MFNDPVHDPHAIADAITASIDATAPGQTIDFSANLIDSPPIANALKRADRRGVTVRAVLARSTKHRTTTNQALADALNTGPRASRLIWSRSSERGADGMMHEKTFRFSRVGDVEWVTTTAPSADGVFGKNCAPGPDEGD